MYVLGGECLSLRKAFSINVNNLLAVLLLPAYLFIRFVAACLLPNSLFYTDAVTI